jgi:hypothetical protein
MAKPELDAVAFPKLSKSKPSDGKLTGSNFTTGDPVMIYGEKKKKWKGKVGDRIGDTTTFNATVDPVKEGKDGKGTEAISVTVTNASNETSDPEPSMSEIID